MLRGKIVLIPFPFDDLSTQKVRPAICLTEPVGPYNHVILAFISSKIPPEPMETDLILKADNPDFAETGLRVTPTIRIHRLLTVGTGIIVRELGIVSSESWRQIERKICLLFGINNN